MRCELATVARMQLLKELGECCARLCVSSKSTQRIPVEAPVEAPERRPMGVVAGSNLTTSR